MTRLLPLLALLALGCQPASVGAQRQPPTVQRIVTITVPPPLEPGTVFTGHYPTHGNFGTCAFPDVRPITGSVELRWAYGAAGSGFLTGAPGDSFTFVVPAGVDTVRVWAERFGVRGCWDTTVVVGEL